MDDYLKSIVMKSDPKLFKRINTLKKDRNSEDEADTHPMPKHISRRSVSGDFDNIDNSSIINKVN
jgi:hypothetical protein